MHRNKTRWSLIGLSGILFLTFCTNQMVPRVGAQAQSCAPGQTTITKKSGNGTICNPDAEIQFFNGTNFVPALVVDPNALFFAYSTIPGTNWVAMNCERTGADHTVFIYRTAFTLPASFSSPSLSIQVHSDNAVEILVNGNSIGAQPDAEDPANFQDPPESFSTTNAGFFIPGANELSFRVHNVGAQITALNFLADICFTPAEGCIDENPPSITCNVAKNSLWPPDHDLINVGLTAVVTDDCDSCEEVEEEDDCGDDDDDHGGHQGERTAQTGGGHHGDDDDDDCSDDDDDNGHVAEREAQTGNRGGGHNDDDDDGGHNDDDDDGGHNDDDDDGDGSGCQNAGLATNVIVYSDEPDLDIPGSGRFSPDAKNTALGTLRLRAERSGTANGRVYLIVVSATDTSGKTGFCVKTVTVPHSQSNASKNSVAAQATAARNFFLANGTPPPGFVQVGIGPIVGPKQ